ncbi:SIR2 family NAD-dependent protein deacylase [Fimbriiglobus ruber]|uniref:USG protein n=1 Tax=Fimbriiglobus ruber TaxID=1908690 RepID=A0A225DX22_9BACT|nr:SIR2 family protein [Fimbriiglobus ruber]OWK42236.1 USG protein [Fimbriiglobus ruber]
MVIDDKTQVALESICDHLTERSACLFLGAGVNYGIENAKGVRCPLGNDLAEHICRDLLDSPNEKLTLSDAAEMARHKLGSAAVSEYVYRLLDSFPYGTAQLALVQLPWDCIYTTNYDLLVEKAARDKTIVPAGNVFQVFSATDDINKLSEEDIPYYKLHGSADHANTPEGRLILTREDYRHYQKHRTKLFKRLKRDLLGRTLIFVGYSMADDNLREILDACREELNIETLPLSYAVRPGSTPLQETFWREKYNIQLLPLDAAEFLVALKDTWQLQNRVALPLVERQGYAFLLPDADNRFQKIGESFYMVRAPDCTGLANPAAFFKGAEPTWGDIRDKIPPIRDAFDHLMEGIFPELVEPTLKASAYLVTGAAGTGKTTLLRTAAYDLANSYGAIALMHISGTPFDMRFIRPLVDKEQPKRIFIIISHASERIVDIGHFVNALRQHKVPATILLEERLSQWEIAKQYLDTKFVSEEYVLGALSDREINEILAALAKYPTCLGKLEGLPLEEQREHFERLAEKDLLVALRELTSGTNFDAIVRDEYARIPSAIAQRAYVFVAALGRIDRSCLFCTAEGPFRMCPWPLIFRHGG